MRAFLSSFMLVDITGSVVIAVIVLLLFIGVLTSLVARARYGSMLRELKDNDDPDGVFQFRVLARASAGLQSLLEHQPRAKVSELNLQGVVDDSVQGELKGLLVAERFLKATPGLLITLGLVGTFYGLTRSIGKLVSIVSSDFALESDMAESLTRGLTDALSGMSVAFTTSLVGIVAAIVMTVLSVLANVGARRIDLMVQLERFLERLAAGRVRPAGEGQAAPGIGEIPDGMRLVAGAEALGEALTGAVGELQGTVTRFNEALNHFADNTREFHDFNAHLKDNIQRMSLSFADLTDALAKQARGERQKGR